MAQRQNRAGHEEPPPQISPEDYAQFIAQIELQQIWVADARLQNRLGPDGPQGAVETRIESHPAWQGRADGFDATQCYAVRFFAGDVELAAIEVTFSLRFTSQQPMTEDVFHIFHDVNLPLNTWPYLREFVATTTGRFGWLPFTLPALKRPARPRSRPPGAPAARSPRARRRAATHNDTS